MTDVQPVTAELRILCQMQQKADQQQAADGRDKEDIELLAGPAVPIK